VLFSPTISRTILLTASKRGRGKGKAKQQEEVDDEEEEVDVEGVSEGNDDEDAQDEVAADSNAPSEHSTPAPTSADRKQKRKASEADERDGSREAKRVREESEAANEADSPATDSKSFKPDPKQKRFQQLITLLHNQISSHRNGAIFHNPIKPSEALDYHDVVKRPMDLKTIKARVKDGTITNSHEFQRDVWLMFGNAMMYNRPGSSIFNMAEEMMLDSIDFINSFQQTEGYARQRQ